MIRLRSNNQSASYHRSTDHSSVWLPTRKSRKYVAHNLIARRGFTIGQAPCVSDRRWSSVGCGGLFCSRFLPAGVKVCRPGSFSFFQWLQIYRLTGWSQWYIDLTATSVIFFSKMPIKRRWAVVLRPSLVHARRLVIHRWTTAGPEKIVSVMGLADSAVSGEVTCQRAKLSSHRQLIYRLTLSLLRVIN